MILMDSGEISSSSRRFTFVLVPQEHTYFLSHPPPLQITATSPFIYPKALEIDFSIIIYPYQLIIMRASLRSFERAALFSTLSHALAPLKVGWKIVSMLLQR
jgi:hypothetical protein